MTDLCHSNVIGAASPLDPTALAGSRRFLVGSSGGQTGKTKRNFVVGNTVSVAVRSRYELTFTRHEATCDPVASWKYSNFSKPGIRSSCLNWTSGADVW